MAPRHEPRTVQSEGSGARKRRAATKATASAFLGLRLGPAARKLQPAAPRAAAPGNQTIPPSARAARDPWLSAVPSLPGTESLAPCNLTRASAWHQRAVEPGVSSCLPRGLILLEALETRIWGLAQGATGVTLFPSQDGAVKEYWRPRFRLAPVLAAFGEGDVQAKARSDPREEDGNDGQVALRVPLVGTIWSLVSVIQGLPEAGA